MSERLEKVRQALLDYEHPLFKFGVKGDDAAVIVEIRFKNAVVPVHTYEFILQPREVDHPQFVWSFQRQLYDCLHDYVVEMFTRNPQLKSH
ncbi:MAG: hypothetical protein L0212_04615 [Acidobacteria bacterium]|nr:hypothetical protein [Acidobacteriota bacterium]